MYKIIIIDDEELVLKGLEQMIDWKSLGCEICASALSAEEGIEKIRKFVPDIIITDIRMKSMSGLEMLEQVADCISHTKVIIMTAYRNFEYAQTAISLGVSDFILKPTKVEHIKNAVAKTVRQLDEMHKSMDAVERLEENNMKLNQLCVEKLLFDIFMFKAFDVKSIQSKLDEYTADFSDYFVVLVNGNSFLQENVSETAAKIRKVFKNKLLFENDFYIVYSNQNTNISVVVCLLDKNTGADVIRKSLVSVDCGMRKLFGEAVSMGVSKRGSGIEKIHERICESYQALEHKIYTGEGMVNFYEDINSMMYAYEYINVYQEQIFSCVVAGNKKRIDDVLKRAEEYLMVQSLKEVQAFTADTVRLYYMYYFKMKASVPEEMINFDCLKDMIYNCSHKDELIDLINSFSRDLVNKIYNYNSNILNDMVEDIIKYINENFIHSITRDDIAKHVHASASYVSTVFNKVTGQTLVKYINSVRINEAKRLLDEGKYSRQEIAGMVGFNDYAYFSNIFKRYTGKSPSKWQKK